MDAMFVVCLAVLCSGCSALRGEHDRLSPNHNCVESKHQQSIIFKEIMGLWNVIQVIDHSERYEERRNYMMHSVACPVVHLSADEDRDVIMVWNADNGFLHFVFRRTNLSNPGFWLSRNTQSGTLVDDYYEHFSGTAQVTKAVQSHMVLTFCSPQQKHFSIVLARLKHLNSDVIRGVQNQLSRLHLPMTKVMDYCENSAVSPNQSAVAAIILVLVVCLQVRHQ